MLFLNQRILKESFENHTTYQRSKFLWRPLTLDGKTKWLEVQTIAYVVQKQPNKSKYYLKPILFLKQTTKTQMTMFNSKKIKRLVDQQNLLDAKINSLAHGQKSLSQNLEDDFKELRQIIYFLEDDILNPIKERLSRIEKQNDMLKKILTDIAKNSQNEAFWKSLEVPMPTWKMRSAPSNTQSSPIQDKLKLEISEIFNDSDTKKSRKSSLPIDKRKFFSVNVNLPEKVINYLYNRSSSKNYATTLRNVFEREGKLVFAPLSTEITKNFVGSKNKLINIQITKNTYLAMLKISKELEMTITQVASNFVATMDSVEATQIGLKYSEFNSKELQTNVSSVKTQKGRPKK